MAMMVRSSWRTQSCGRNVIKRWTNEMSAAGVFLRYRQYLAGFGGDWYNWLRQKESAENKNQRGIACGWCRPGRKAYDVPYI